MKIVKTFIKIMVLLNIFVVSFLFLEVLIAGFENGFDVLKTHLLVGAQRGKIEKQTILENHSFDDNSLIETKLSECINNSEEQHAFDINILSYSHPCIDINKISLVGPFGIQIILDEGVTMNENKTDMKLGKVISTKEENKKMFISYTESNIRFSKKNNNDYELKAEISGDKWEGIAERSWNFIISNGNSLIHSCGEYKLYFLLKTYIIRYEGNDIEVLEEDYLEYSYDFSVNDEYYFQGIMNKNGSQKNYVFQLSTDLSSKNIIPKSEKIIIHNSKIVNLNVAISNRYYYEAVKIKIYEVDEFTLEEKLIEEMDLNFEDEFVQTVSLDGIDWKNGLYKIELSGNTRLKVSKIYSIFEIFKCIFLMKSIEEYEYYFKLGDSL